VGTDRGEQHGSENHGDRESAGPGDLRPDLSGVDDVADPETAGDEREEHADEVEVRPAEHRFGTENDHPCGGDTDPDQVSPVLRGQRREHQGPGELQGDGGRQRNPADRGVVEAVHQGHGHGEEDDGPPVAGLPRPHRGPGDGEQDQPADAEAQQGHPPAPEVIEETDGGGRTELQRGAGAEDAQHRKGHRRCGGGRCRGSHPDIVHLT